MTCPHPINPATRQKNIEDNSARFLEIEPKLHDLHRFMTLAALSFEFMFDTEATKPEHGIYDFRIDKHSIESMQFAFDEMRDMFRKILKAID